MKNENALISTFIPELGTPRRGKVRDIYDLGDTLTLISSDRTSIFDIPLQKPIPGKGRILNEISRFWFEKTKDIVPNHLLDAPDPNVMVVKRCKPYEIEVIVRAYIVGSLWQDYQKGKRTKCGVTLPEGLQENDPLPEPIITPTTKAHEGHDEDITPEEIISQGLATAQEWETIKKTAFALFRRGQEVLKERGIILVDTKYEFGVDTQGDLVLIDEIHTPDSSRFWQTSDYEKKQIRFPDKEYLRKWSRENNVDPRTPFPDEVMETAARGYREVLESLTAKTLLEDHQRPDKRVLEHLKNSGMIQGSFALLISGSEKDQGHIEKLTHALDDQNIPSQWIVASAHKQTQTVIDLLKMFEESLEPVVMITVAGRSNALSGVVACNSRWPVIACPPFKDYSEYAVNIHSTLQMPSHTPVLTVLDPGNAAMAARRIFDLGSFS